MKKVIVSLVVCLCGVSFAFAEEQVTFNEVFDAEVPSVIEIAEPIPGQSYFDQRFDALERSTAEIKGDTTQIVSILGNVFEGTVPSGGTLTKLCNDMGWNLVVLMGHNNISNPNVVAAGESFSYPQTHEEFQEALAKGKPLYDAWLKNQSTTFRVNRMKVDTAEIDELNVRVASFKEKLEIKNMEIDQLQVRLAEITEKLSVKKAEIEELNVKVANLEEVNIDELKVKDAQIENLRIENLRVKNALIDKLRIKQLEIDNLQELLALAEKRCQELEARPPKVVTETKTVYKTVGGQEVYSASCDEVPFPVSGFWSALRDGEYVEFKYRPEKSDQFKAVRVLKEDGWVKPSCRRFWTQTQISSLDAKSLLDNGEKLHPALNWELPEGDGGENLTYMVMSIIK